LVWSVSDRAFDPVWRFEFVAPGFESAAPSEIVWQVLGGDAVEAVEPLFEAAVVGVDVVDVQMGRFRGWLSWREHRVERNPGSAGEGGDWPAAVADQMVVLCDDAGKRSSYGSTVDLRQDRVEGRALPIAGDENGNIVLIGPRMPGLAASFARRARQIGPSALEGFEDEGLVRFDDPA